VRRTTYDVFAILVREHELAVVAFVRSCVRDPAAVDDIVQESFIAAWRHLDTYIDVRPFANWLRGIASNKVLEYFRSHAKAQHHQKTLPPDILTKIAEQHDRLFAPTGSTFFDRLTPLQECLETLDARLRSTIEHHYQHRLTCRVIADRLGESVEAVKKRLQRARAALKDCITAKLASDP
jgi:RNA polymerase sigma-70 factor, ECF subfamily